MQYNALALLASGSILALVTSYISEKGLTSPSAQLLPLSKYLTIIGYVYFQKRYDKRSRRPISRLGKRLIWSIGALSVVAYCLYCVGFALAGTGLAIAVHAATGQTFTAIFSRLLLKQKLTRRQTLAVLIVNLGLCLRLLARPPSSREATGASEWSGIAHTLGAAAITGSSICYALLGVQFDRLLKAESPAPSYSQIMELLFSWPRQEQVLWKPLAASGVGPIPAAGLYLSSGLIFVWHYANMTDMFRTDGPVAVGLVNALRGAVVSLIAGWLHCSDHTADQCNSFWTVASALVVTSGAVLWTLGGGGSGKRQAVQKRPAKTE